MLFQYQKWVRNGIISITQRDFISGYYKVKSVGQWEKILIMAMGFVDHLGLSVFINFVRALSYTFELDVL